MRCVPVPALTALMLGALLGTAGKAAEAPKPATNAPPVVKTLNTPRDFPAVSSKEDWQAQAKQIREQVLVSCGLWPLPPRPPLQAQIFGHINRGDYSVEKVCFQSLPGFYVAGNLYRPRDSGTGLHPAVINPHGHWKEGRLVDGKDGSVAARCISFARQGIIAFSYDMVGYNDTFFADYGSATPDQFYQRHNRFATNQVNLLWNISLMGLQTWNSIRALDFLESLPDVDRKKLACTGASGGGTQTFMLGAIDDRLAAQAPVVMVSHTMQGGCLCENAPGLRVEHSNMEIAAAAAPRPQILVAATGDWTKDTPTVEGPAIQHVYELFGAKDRFHFVQFDFKHNYNQTSREAVYEWFGKWLLKRPLAAWLKEAPYQKEPDADLRVFPDDRLPEDAATEARAIAWLKEAHRSHWESLVPRDNQTLAEFRRVIQPAWKHTLQADWPNLGVRCRTEQKRQCGEFTAATLKISRREGQDILTTYWTPANFGTNPAPRVVVTCSDENKSAPAAGADDKPTPVTAMLLQRGLAVLSIDRFSSVEVSNQFTNFYCVYNRTKLQERVRDLLTVCSAASTVPDARGARFVRVIVWGTGRAGLWALLAAPAAAGVVADGAQLDVADEQLLLQPDLFCPGIRNIGTFEAGAMLAAPHPLLLHNTGDSFSTEGIRAAYRAAAARDKVRVVAAGLPNEEVLDWITQIK